MQNAITLDDQQYDPNRLLDFLIKKMRVKNDAGLSRKLDVAPPVLSKIRHRRTPIGATMLIRMHEVSDINIAELRKLMGVHSEKYRVTPKVNLSENSLQPIATQNSAIGSLLVKARHWNYGNVLGCRSSQSSQSRLTVDLPK